MRILHFLQNVVVGLCLFEFPLLDHGLRKFGREGLRNLHRLTDPRALNDNVLYTALSSKADNFFQ
jgi:hypothetical protein